MIVWNSPNVIVFAPVDPEPESTTSGSEVVPDSDLIDKMDLNNHLLVGVIFFLGILAGLLCMSHFFSRFRK